MFQAVGVKNKPGLFGFLPSEPGVRSGGRKVTEKNASPYAISTEVFGPRPPGLELIVEAGKSPLN